MPFEFFKKPYPFTEGNGKIIRGNLLIGVFVASFLIVFQPFEINLWQTSGKTLKLAGFGVISFLIPTLIAFVTRKIIDPVTREEKWTIGKEIISISLVLSFIAVGNLLYARFLGIMPLSAGAFLTILSFTCILGVFPVSLHVMQKHNRLMLANLEKAKAINSLLDPAQPNTTVSVAGPVHPSGSGKTLHLTAENEKDVFDVKASSLLYIESSDNYSSVFYLENEEVKKKLIRSSLKRLELQINDEKIVRCHRTYIVNLANITKVQGNAAGYRLSISGTGIVIPVSRSYIQVINSLSKAASN